MYCRVRFDMMVPPSQPLRQSVPVVLCSPGRMENSSLYLLCLISAWYWQKVQKAVRKIVQKWSRFRPQPEPDAPDRFNMVFASRVPQLAAQIADVGLERAFRAVRRVRADAVEQDGFCQHLSGILHQQLQDGVFRPGQRNRSTGGAYLVGGRVQRQTAAGIDRRQRRTGRLPQPNSYAGQQLLRVEGLREIIRRAAQQQSDLVLHRRFALTTMTEMP